jgi:hypothetical protein
LCPDIFRVSAPDHYNPSALLDEILQEYCDNSIYAIPVIHGYLKALFAKILRFAEIKSYQNNVPVSLCEKFQDLIAKQCPEIHKVSVMQVC